MTTISSSLCNGSATPQHFDIFAEEERRRGKEGGERRRGERRSAKEGAERRRGERWRSKEGGERRYGTGQPSGADTGAAGISALGRCMESPCAWSLHASAR